MMAVLFGSARNGENGATGNQAGDQSGKEVSTQNWYKHSKGWVVIRAKDSAVAEKIAYAMEAACNNNLIGYDQGDRGTLYAAAKSVGFDPAKVEVKCECDCSSLVRVCVCYAGIEVGNFTTAGEASALMATGAFLKLTTAQYTDSSDYLKRGDILVTKTQGHTGVILSNGSKVTKPVTYFPKCTIKTWSIVDALVSVGANWSYAYRAKIAAVNGIKNYKGTALQNGKMVVLLKAGKLVKPEE